MDLNESRGVTRNRPTGEDVNGSRRSINIDEKADHRDNRSTRETRRIKWCVVIGPCSLGQYIISKDTQLKRKKSYICQKVSKLIVASTSVSKHHEPSRIITGCRRRQVPDLASGYAARVDDGEVIESCNTRDADTTKRHVYSGGHSIWKKWTSIQYKQKVHAVWAPTGNLTEIYSSCGCPALPKRDDLREHSSREEAEI